MPFSSASVVRTEALSDRFRRIVLHVEDPAALNLPDAADTAVGVYFDPADGEGRNYSVRTQDGPAITLDVATHCGGPGTRWAATAVPGQRVGLDHARAWHRPGPGTDWQLLVSDLSGLPAAARILEQMAPDERAILFAEVADRRDLDYLPWHPGVVVRPHIGTGNGHAPSDLARAVRAYRLPPGRGYCWFAGEAGQSRLVRKYLRGRGWTIDQYDITGYWRQGSEEWDERFAAAGGDALSVYARALAAGKDGKVAFEEFDHACEQAGL
ncbi:NADPH-dependent ferric siderophore reductase [Mycolicibacterium duvalii]|uniref:Siderophore-interacting protein n=1 Tax=Mycolicibacterium duvalii TaxID=39688 RepID=A0A7I7JWR8_9MYCO|nr:siderophore-interacting protein [Mycolicibacterium duvalii]MCV7369522.1 siderophore-interacting protein [Mycolicibacterium duvalii]PEG42159.1 NADPH-dependent ferric siderophore reductase [Mycolicibacterium duvalii]BBX16243.1 siderophore-interacting protein [Mycolicibacterium duvalii]